MSGNRRLASGMFLLILTVSQQAHAQAPPQSAPQAPPQTPSAADDGDTPRESPYRFRSIFKDAKDYALAPLRWDTGEWIYLGGAVAAVAAAHGFDETVRRSFTSGESPATALNGKDTHSLTDALPAAVVVGATFFSAWNVRSDAGRSETWAMLEAAGLGSATAYLLKFAAGRAGPNETTSDNQWRKGGSSFPSLHVTFATAIGTVLAEDGSDDFRWLRRLLGYGMAGGTAYLRLKHNEHWLSDTVAGAALGGSSGVFALHRDHPGEQNRSLGVVPVSGGAVLAYVATF